MPVLIRCRLRRWCVLQAGLGKLAQKILAGAGARHAELSLVLVGDRRMRRLNRHYRGISRPTDVLAFPMQEGPGPACSLLGDVVIALPTAARQAAFAGHSLDQEVVLLLIHGVLHLVGYDHERSPHEARRMRRKEQAILRSLGRIPRLVKDVKRDA